MNKGIIKKIVAVGVSLTMTFGMAVTSFAAQSQGVEGTGSTVGHVEKKVINVAWPTTTGTDFFSYVMDAEGLIAEAGKYKANAVTLPSTGDTHVYFETATSGTYANTSQAYTVTNKSSHKVEISATATASVTSGTMIDLVDTAADATGASTPKLYLGLTVGSETKAVTAEGATAKDEANGYAANFELKSKADGSFEYGIIASPDDSKWDTVDVTLTGAVSQVTDIGNVVAPKVAVTWSYVDPTAGPQITMTAAGVITISGLTAAQNFKGLTIGSGSDLNNIRDFPFTQDTSNYSDSTGGTLIITLGSAYMSYYGGKATTATLTLTDNSTKTVTTTLASN